MHERHVQVEAHLLNRYNVTDVNGILQQSGNEISKLMGDLHVKNLANHCPECNSIGAGGLDSLSTIRLRISDTSIVIRQIPLRSRSVSVSVVGQTNCESSKISSTWQAVVKDPFQDITFFRRRRELGCNVPCWERKCWQASSVKNTLGIYFPLNWWD